VSFWNHNQFVTQDGVVFQLPIERLKENTLPYLGGPDYQSLKVLEAWNQIYADFKSKNLIAKGMNIDERGAWQVTLDNDIVLKLGRGEWKSKLERFVTIYPQVDVPENKKIDLETLKYIHSHKTGKLIKLPIEIACIIANVEKGKREVLEEYADLIGIAFQVKDDILDVEGSFEDLGKPVGSDVDLHKATYPSILGMEESKKILNDTVEKAKKIIKSKFGEEKGKILISLADFIKNRNK